METVYREPTIGYLVWRLSMRWRAKVDRAVAPYGLTHATYSVLASLYGETQAHARPTQRHLADITGMDAVYISKLVRSLERDGLVKRAPHPDDSRAVKLTLSRLGRARITKAIDTVSILHDDLLAPLGGPHGPASLEFKAALVRLLDDPTPGGMT
jgi:MarR family transcriptional regulator, organic hydroperoxide resistance regulator